MQVIIIGGGISGLAAAIALRRVGVDAQVYEQAPELKEIGAGLSLWANGVKALHLLGVADALAEVSCPVEVVGTRTKQGRWLNRISLDSLHQRVGFESVAMHRGNLLQLLLNAVDPRTVHPGMRLERIENDATGVKAVFDDGTTATADILIASDGVASTVRKQLFPDAVEQYAGYSTWRGVVEDLDLPADWPQRALIRTLGCGQYFGVGQLGDNRHLWFMTQNRAFESVSTHGGKDELMRSVSSWASPVPDLVDATPEKAVLLHPVYRLRPLKAWHWGRVLLVGDAAHPIEPALGMGAALALEDGVQHASSLASHDGYEDAFRHYQTRRLSRVMKLIRWSSVLARTEQVANPAACGLRDLALRLPAKRTTLMLARGAMTFNPQ